MSTRIGIFGLVFLVASSVWGQSKTTSSLTGTVKGQERDPIVGAAVTIESPQLIGGARTVVTDAKGGFRFPEIAPGEYTVTVVMSGYKTLKREQVRLPVGITLDLPMTLIAFAGEETVTVTGEPPAIDVTSPETKTILSNEVLQNLPASQFQPDTLNLAPGINQTVAYGGASDTGVAWEIDGVDTSDPEAGSAWSFVNYNIIDQVSLNGLGAPAEYGGFTGIAFNSTTKSGSNDLHGLVDAYYTKGTFTSDNGAPAGLNPTQKNYINTTVNVGGPFVKDKLWYYISGQYYNTTTNNGGPDRNEKSPRLFGKVTWQINPSNTFNAWIEWDRYDITGRGGDAHTPIESTVTETAPEYVWNVAWKNVISKDLIFDMTFQGYTGYYYLDPASGYGLAGHLDAITGDYSQNSYYYYKADRGRNQLNASISKHLSDWGGAHDFKFGVEIERSTLRSRYGYPTGQWIYNNYYGTDPGTGITDYQGTVQYTGGSYDLRATNERATFYAQDDWQITPRFTLNPGVRFDYIVGKVPDLGKVYDYLAIAPRLGFAWNVTGDNANLIKAHVGRYYAGAHATYYYWVDPGAFENSQRIVTWPSGTVEADPVRTKTYAIDPNLKQPYMDQAILGVRPRARARVRPVRHRDLPKMEAVRRDGRPEPGPHAGDGGDRGSRREREHRVHRANGHDVRLEQLRDRHASRHEPLRPRADVQGRVGDGHEELPEQLAAHRVVHVLPDPRHDRQRRIRRGVRQRRPGRRAEPVPRHAELEDQLGREAHARSDQRGQAAGHLRRRARASLAVRELDLLHRRHVHAEEPVPSGRR